MDVVVSAKPPPGDVTFEVRGVFQRGEVWLTRMYYLLCTCFCDNNQSRFLYKCTLLSFHTFVVLLLLLLRLWLSIVTKQCIILSQVFKKSRLQRFLISVLLGAQFYGLWMEKQKFSLMFEFLFALFWLFFDLFRVPFHFGIQIM